MIGFNYLKLGIWSYIYYSQKEKSEIIFDIIIQNLKNSGCIALKFVQWILPKIEHIYGIDRNDPKNEWFCNLETIYENCNFHSIDYTKKVYKAYFKKDLEEDYTIIEKVASGSIGQVYKIKDKEGKVFALKTLHPNIESQVNRFHNFIRCIYLFSFIKNYVNYLVPIDLNDFIIDFKIQTDLVNEGNNCLYFYEKYKNNPYIIIPQVYSMSKHVLIMSYEGGESFYDLNVSDYVKYKLILLFKLFNKNNEIILKYLHGDLHKGNWKVRKNEKNEYQIIVYDYGFCWKLPNMINDNLYFIQKSFMKTLKNEEDILNFSKACWIFLEKKYCLKKITREINSLLKENNVIKLEGPQLLLNIIFKIARKHNIIIKSHCLQSMVLYNQIWKLYEDYNLGTGGNGTDFYEEYYLYRIYDIINYCETFDIFLEYKNHIENELVEELKINPSLKKIKPNIEIQSKFNSLKKKCI